MHRKPTAVTATATASIFQDSSLHFDWCPHGDSLAMLFPGTTLPVFIKALVIDEIHTKK